jgi:hypothetical protein
VNTNIASSLLDNERARSFKRKKKGGGRKKINLLSNERSHIAPIEVTSPIAGACARDRATSLHYENINDRPQSFFPHTFPP